MALHRYASGRQYAEHLGPIWEALPEGLRGESWAPRVCDWGVPPTAARPDGPVLVASYADARAMAGRDLIYGEHGAGQHYPGDPRANANGSYAGGDGLDRVRLFLSPSERVAERWRLRYPQTPTAVVGCPKLDALHRERPPRGKGPVVAIAHHWSCSLVPETADALAHYWRGYDALRDALRGIGGELWGTGHPRAWAGLERFWRNHEVRAVPGSLDVLAAADVVVFDNTSLGWEAASLDIPLVLLDAPWYRRNVDHGLRFWTHADAGVRIGEARELVPAVMEALLDEPEVADRRRTAALDVYAYADGKASQRAADAIVEVLAA